MPAYASDSIVGQPLLTAPLQAEVIIALDSQLTDYLVPIPMGIFNDYILSASTGTQTLKVRLNYDSSQQSGALRGNLMTPPGQWSYNNLEGHYLYVTTGGTDAGKTATFQFRGR